MTISKKYKISELGISSPGYILGQIQGYLIHKNYDVETHDGYLKFMNKPKLLVERGGFTQAIVQIYEKNDYMILKLYVSNIYIILGLFFLTCATVSSILSVFFVFPGAIILAAFMLSIVVLLNGVFQLFEARKKLDRIDEFVWSFK